MIPISSALQALIALALFARCVLVAFVQLPSKALLLAKRAFPGRQVVLWDCQTTVPGPSRTRRGES